MHLPQKLPRITTFIVERTDPHGLKHRFEVDIDRDRIVTTRGGWMWMRGQSWRVLYAHAGKTRIVGTRGVPLVFAPRFDDVAPDSDSIVSNLA